MLSVLEIGLGLNNAPEASLKPELYSLVMSVSSLELVTALLGLLKFG